jgi:hypothetical protein
LMTATPDIRCSEGSLGVLTSATGPSDQNDIRIKKSEEQPQQFLLFGGANHEQGFLDDLYLLRNVHPELVWNPIKIFSSLSGPVARYEHAALCVKRKHVESQELLIMFGAGNEGPLADCWVYNMGNLLII